MDLIKAELVWTFKCPNCNLEMTGEFKKDHLKTLQVFEVECEMCETEFNIEIGE